MDSKYRAIYRAAYNFHEKYSQFTVDPDYWSTHEPGAAAAPDFELDYWDRAVSDMAALSNTEGLKCTFFDRILSVVFADLEASYMQAARSVWEKAHGTEAAHDLRVI